eukprot:3380829-Heterocapsa_arctica.AAC.1
MTDFVQSVAFWAMTDRTNTSWCTVGRKEIHGSFICDKINLQAFSKTSILRSTLETRSDAESGNEGKVENKQRAGEEQLVTSSIE